MAKKPTTEVFVPGRAYEVVMEAPFVKQAKKLDTLPADAMAARVALKNGEKRNKGRGYRVLVKLNHDAAVFLCEWYHEFLASDGYRALGTADALAIRTIAERLCSVSDLTAAQEAKRQEMIARRTEKMLATKARQRAEAAVGAKERVDAYRAWVEADRAYYDALNRRRNGDDSVTVPVKPRMPVIPDKDDYEAAGLVTVEAETEAA